MPSAPIALYSSCPDRLDPRPEQRRAQLLDAARWAESAGHQALLIRTDNRLLDPWAVAQLVLHETQRLRPIVTVQPLHAHPYAVAKRVASLGQIYGRTPHLNLAAGTYRGDLLSLGDSTPHDQRYERLVEFGRVVRALLSAEDSVVFDGAYYRLHKPAGLPPLPASQEPELFVCSGSAAGRTAAVALEATMVHHAAAGAEISSGCVRVGIIARDTEEAAWQVARTRFPANRATRFAHRLDLALSDSHWQADLQDAARGDEAAASLWLDPFENRQSQCAYVVGSHVEVARHVRGWLEAGVRAFLLDAPVDPADLEHTAAVFERAWRRHSSSLAVSA